ncbi:hypothetical protein BCR44DRAFT_1439366 [Catenaria anguillulae PL171]|uniref:Uncharacterized protein n=1 Tax=Catenaria anguillulae PL171 TaxID=765915 RepID=A0A1Y2HE48_9FUNG|nr:hypothetical protein BCR44DRAFT_1439366 [Catenaria anguillulae PL171]
MFTKVIRMSDYCLPAADSHHLRGPRSEQRHTNPAKPAAMALLPPSFLVADQAEHAANGELEGEIQEALARGTQFAQEFFPVDEDAQDE